MPRYPGILIAAIMVMAVTCCTVTAGQQIAVTSAEMNTGSTAPITLTLDKAPQGLSGFKIFLNVSDPSIAEIASVVYPNGFGLSKTTPLPFTSGEIKAMDLYGTTVPEGSTEILLATLNIRGLSPGTTTLIATLSPLGLSGNIAQGGMNYVPNTTVIYGTITVHDQQSAYTTTTTPQSIDRLGSMPRDADNDGLYEDITGDGTLDFSDVTYYFENINWIQENEPVSLFDFNKNGMIDFGDIVILNQKL
jgi:PKD repeat protein